VGKVEVNEDGGDDRRIREERPDPHVRSAGGAQQGQNIVDGGEEHCPTDAGAASAAEGLGGGDGVLGDGTIQGMDNLMVRYSQCCRPVPGDRFIALDVHRGVDAEPAWALPGEHAVGVVFLEQALDAEVAEDAALDEALEGEPVVGGEPVASWKRTVPSEACSKTPSGTKRWTWKSLRRWRGSIMDSRSRARSARSGPERPAARRSGSHLRRG